MRKTITIAAFVLWAVPSAALAQSPRTSIQGFGGLTFDPSSALGRETPASALGGVVTTDLTSNIQVVGEIGRLSDVQSPLYDLLAFTPVQLRISAWYGEGGVRFIASRGLALRPYAEATAGMARLNTRVSGFGGPIDPFIAAGLGFLNSTEPVARRRGRRALRAWADLGGPRVSLQEDHGGRRGVGAQRRQRVSGERSAHRIGRPVLMTRYCTGTTVSDSTIGFGIGLSLEYTMPRASVAKYRTPVVPGVVGSALT